MITTRNHDTVRELQLNHPPANAISPQVMVALRQAVEAAPRDGARALVLSGTPGMFSAGLDVPALLTLSRDEMGAAWHDFYGLLRSLAASPIPIAAAITGHAPAGGAVLSLFCDWRTAAEGDFKIGLNEVQVGLTLPPLIYSALRLVVGQRQAERLGVAGLLVSPTESLRAGLIDEIVPPEQVIARAIAWCREMLALPPVAMGNTRRMARADLTRLFESNLETEISQVTASWWGEETQAVLHNLVQRLASKKKGA
jgi:enoyl-CoA hydratase/carnithine racemase